jgi:hypothetical protein
VAAAAASGSARISGDRAKPVIRVVGGGWCCAGVAAATW